MVLGDADIEVGVSLVVPHLLGVVPVVVTGMGLGDAYEHPDVIAGPQRLLETEVRTGSRAVVVGVDVVDADIPEPAEALADRPVVPGRGPEERVIDGKSGEIDATAVQVEVLAVNPELAESEVHGAEHVQRPILGIHQGELNVVHVLRGVQIPELVGMPIGGEGVASVDEVAASEHGAGEAPHRLPSVRDLRAQAIGLLADEVCECHAEADPPLAHGRVNLEVRDASRSGCTRQIHVAAEPATFHAALDLAGRCSVVEG